MAALMLHLNILKKADVEFKYLFKFNVHGITATCDHMCTCMYAMCMHISFCHLKRRGQRIPRWWSGNPADAERSTSRHDTETKRTVTLGGSLIQTRFNII